MELGGLNHHRDRVFLLSTTHGAETHALAAALEVMRIYEDENIIETLYDRGRRLADGVRNEAAARGLQDHFVVLGRESNLIYATLDAHGRRSQEFRTLFLQESIRRGLLAPSLVVSAALTDDDIDRTVGIVGETLDIYLKGLESGIIGLLEDRPVKPVFRRFA